MRNYKNITNVSNKIISTLTQIFTAHPKSAGESYLQHFAGSIKAGLIGLIGAMVLIIHAILPFLWIKEGGDLIIAAANIIHKRRKRT